MPSIKFDTIVETAKVVSGFRDIQNAVHQTAERVEKDGKSIDDVISNIQNSMNIAIGGWSIGKFVNQMMQVRGQFQQTEMAFKTMLQSEEKADALMKQLIRTAAVTPFGVEDVTEGAKQLLAFNVAAEDVNKTLIGLGDVAAGMGLNLKDLVMLYGTTIAKGKMDTMDLYQFLNRGIPIADELAKVMGLDLNNAIGEVQKQIKAGKVTSDVFIQAMQSMTAEGSKFGGLMEAQSKTITGQISNIKDAIEQMFNELGKSQEGVINTGLGVVSTLVENWETVGKVLMTVVAAYGAYKAAVIAMIAISKAQVAWESAKAFLSLAKSITTAKDAMALFNMVSSSNVLGLVLGAVAAGVTMFNLFGNSAEDAATKTSKFTEDFGNKATSTKNRINALQKQLQGAGEDVHVLYNRVKEFMQNYGVNDVKFRIQFDAEIPSWMNNMDVKELGKMGRWFSALARDLGNNNKSGAKVNGKWMPTKAIAQRGWDYTNAANTKQTKAEDDAKQKRREKEEAEANAKKNASKAKKAAADAKKLAEDRKKAQEELNEDLKQLQQENIDTDISQMQEGTEKKIAEIKNDYAKRKAEIDKQEAEFKKKNKEAGKKVTLTSAQSNALNKARDLATQEYNKKLDEVNREALTSMRDYLKEYGSLYQQKQAIAEEYEEKIAKAQTQGEKLSLQQQRKKDLQTIEINAIRQNIDWGSVFGDFGAMFKDQLEPTIEKLQELSKSTTDVNEQKTIQELISKLQGSATVWDSDIFKKVSDDINSYQSAMQGYIDAQEREIEATKAVTKAQEDLAKAKKSGDKTSISKAEANLSRAQGVLATASNNVLEFGSSVQKASSDLQTSAQKAVSQFQQLENGLQGLTSGSLKGIGNSILGLDKLFGGSMQKDVANTLAKGIQGLLGKDSDAAKSLTKALGDSGMAGEIISAILGILDILKDGFGTLISNLMDTVFGAVTGILDDALSGDIVMKPLKSIGNNVSHILNTLSFGGFNSLFGGDGNAKKVNDTIERLTDRNTLLQQSIEDLTDAMENSFGFKATSYYEQAYKNQQETNQNYLDIAKAQASYHGSHHSWNRYWSGFGSEEIDWIKKNVKSDFNGDLFSLSPEEMKLLRGNVAIWEHIENTGKGNYGGRLTEKLNDYIDQAGKLEELSEQFKENLTQISFSGMRDSFLTDLMDMKKDGSDFASEMTDDFAEKMQKSLLSFSMEDLINGDLKKLYDDWAKAMKDKNGKLTKEDVDAFYKRYDDIVQEGLKRRDEWAKVTGYTGSSSSSQTATSGGWASMGQDTADELNGRFTALQIAGESIAQNMTTTISQMESIVTLGISTNGAVLEIRNMMIMTNSYLEDIVKYSKLTYNDFGTKLDDMNRRLKDI